MRIACEAGLQIWGFDEITRAPVANKSARTLEFFLKPTEPTVYHVRDGSGMPFTLVIDPVSRRIWSRPGHASCLDLAPCRLFVHPETVDVHRERIRFMRYQNDRR